MKKGHPLQNLRFFLRSDEGSLVTQFFFVLLALLIIVGCIVLLVLIR